MTDTRYEKTEHWDGNYCAMGSCGVCWRIVADVPTEAEMPRVVERESFNAPRLTFAASYEPAKYRDDFDYGNEFANEQAEAIDFDRHIAEEFEDFDVPDMANFPAADYAEFAEPAEAEYEIGACCPIVNFESLMARPVSAPVNTAVKTDGGRDIINNASVTAWEVARERNYSGE